MIYNTFDVILQDHEATEATAFARGFVFGECEVSECNIAHARHVDTIEGIEIYYDYGADYYFFCPAIEVTV